jgi:hypothetical protein
MSLFSNIIGSGEGDPKSTPVKNPPASQSEITAFEAKAGVKLLPALVALYSQSNGVKPEHAQYVSILRLMPLLEVVEMQENFQQTGLAVMLKQHGMVFFWTDDSSNYVGVCCAGVFKGYVFFLDHDGYYSGDLSPVFRSVESFQECLAEAVARNQFVNAFEEGEIEEEELNEKVKPFTHYRYYEPMDTVDWHAFPVDYPSELEKYSEADRVAYEKCRAMIESCQEEEERRFLIYALARLVPPAERAGLFPYLKEDDLWMPARLASMLVSLREMEAVPHIVTLALAGNYNCQSSAKSALAKLILLEPQAKGSIKEEYSRQGGDYGEIQRDLAALERSPSLFYQW